MKLLGMSEEVTDCSCCGRTGLKETVAFENNGGIVHFGTTCATKQVKWSAKKLTREIKLQNSTTLMDYAIRKKGHPLCGLHDKLVWEANEAKMPFTQRPIKYWDLLKTVGVVEAYLSFNDFDRATIRAFENKAEGYWEKALIMQQAFLSPFTHPESVIFDNAFMLMGEAKDNTLTFYIKPLKALYFSTAFTLYKPTRSHSCAGLLLNCSKSLAQLHIFSDRIIGNTAEGMSFVSLIGLENCALLREYFQGLKLP